MMNLSLLKEFSFVVVINGTILEPGKGQKLIPQFNMFLIMVELLPGQVLVQQF